MRLQMLPFDHRHFCLLLIGAVELSQGFRQMAWSIGYRPPRLRSAISSTAKGLPALSQGSNMEREIEELERQILLSAKEKMDYNQITRALDLSDSSSSGTDARAPLPSTVTWQVAVTAASVTATGSLFLFSNLYVSAFVWVAIFLVANADPLQDDSVLGALARIVGRKTLQSYETSKPKIKAVARAVVTGKDEIQELKRQLKQLQDERAEMDAWRGLVYGTDKANYQNTSPNARRDMTSKQYSVDKEIAKLERQIQASVQESMDYNQITRALDSPSPRRSDDSARSATMHSWQVAVTAASVAATGSFVLFTNPFVSIFVWVATFVVANADPMQDDSLLGSLARVLGRATLESYETSKPKMQALVRAVVTGQDEVRELRQKLDQVQAERDELATWKQRRLWVEHNLAYYSVEDLKQSARMHRLAVSGTKMQLLQRLVDAGIIDTRPPPEP